MTIKNETELANMTKKKGTNLENTILEEDHQVMNDVAQNTVKTGTEKTKKDIADQVLEIGNALLQGKGEDLTAETGKDLRVKTDLKDLPVGKEEDLDLQEDLGDLEVKRGILEDIRSLIGLVTRWRS